MTLETMTRMMGKMAAECAVWLADGTKPKEIKEILRDNLIPVFGNDLATAMVKDIMDDAAKQALDILEKRAMEEPISLCTMYEIING